MAISKLNTLFTKHHRIIFGVFAVLIILAFVLADWIGGGGSLFGSKSPADQTVASVLGKNVTEQDMYERQRQLYLTHGQVSSEVAQQQALQMLALDILAERNRIAVSEDEVNKAIIALFKDKDGKFQKDRYSNFVDKTLKQQGFTEDDFVAALRQQLVREKMVKILSESVVVTEDECRNLYNLMNHRIESMSCVIKTADFEKQVKVTEELLMQFFNANRAKYMIPARLSAQVVKFSPADFIKDVQYTEDELKAYYESQKDSMPPVKDKAGKDVTPTFEQVKAAIINNVKMLKAADLANTAASNFSRDAYDKIKDQTDALKIFNSFAAEKKLAVISTGSFSANASKAGSLGTGELVQKLAAVATLDIKLSEVIFDSDSFYVGYVTEYIPARQAEYKEVAAQVRKDFIAAEAGKLALKRAEEITAKLAALAPADRIARARAGQKTKFTAGSVVTLQNIQSAKSQLNMLTYLAMQNPAAAGYFQAQIIAQNMELSKQLMLFDLKTGDISKPVPTSEGYEIIIVTARKSAEKPYAASADFTNMVKQDKAQQLLLAVLEYCSVNTKTAENNNEQEAAK